MINTEDIKKVSIVDVVSKFISIKKDGANYQACCPFHNEKTPSFKLRYNATENFYKCFGCGVSGDSIEFVKNYKNVDFLEACKIVADIGGVILNQDQESPYKAQKSINTMKSVQTYSKPKIIQQEPSKEVIEWFNNRGISERTITTIGIQESFRYFGGLKKEAISIDFNYYKNGELVNVKHRCLEDKQFSFEKDCELTLFNVDNIIDNGKSILFTEGEIDALSLMETFNTFVNIVSVPNGASLGKNQNLDYLDSHYVSNLLIGRKLVLCFDNDIPGNNLKDAFLKRFGEENCYVLDYPETCKDINDVLVKYGKDVVKTVIENRRFNRVNGIVNVVDFMNEIDTYYTHGFPTTSKIGCKNFDKLISFRPGELTMVTGVFGSGKSEFLDFIAKNLSQLHNWRFGICSMETPPSLHFIKLAEKLINKPFRDVYNNTGNIAVKAMSVEELNYAKQFVYDHYDFIRASIEELANGDRDRGVLDIDYILKQAKKLKAMYNIDSIIIDPWNTIEHQFRNGENETNYISRILSKVIAFAEDFQVHVFLVAHPTKSVTDRIALLSDISGSGNFANKTHNGISVFREKDSSKNPNNVIEVHILKIKHKFVGRLGVAYFSYDTVTGNYTETDMIDY